MNYPTTRAACSRLWRSIPWLSTSLLPLCATAAIATSLIVAVAVAQTPAPPQGATGFAPKPEANLLQLMRGVMFPEANVVFAAQEDISKIPPAPQPARSPNLLTSVFGGWEAVENSSLALAETADLLVLPGRVCGNGRPVPVEAADWVKFVNEMRATALDAYKTAKTKSVDDMVDAAGAVSDACQACHNAYRSNRVGMEGRCIHPPAAPATPAAKP